MRRLLVLLVGGSLLASLGACETPQEACASYGYSPGTLEFAQCSERRSVETQRAWQRQAQYWNAYNAATRKATSDMTRSAQVCGWEGPQWVCR